MRAKQLADIRAAAEAQPSKVEKTPVGPPKSLAKIGVKARQAKFSMKQKANKDRRPSLPGNGDVRRLRH